MIRNINYNRGDEIIEVIIRDSSGSKMQVWRNNVSDHKANGKLLSCLIKKWGMKFDAPDKSWTNIDNEFFRV